MCGWNKEVIRMNEMSKKIFKGRKRKWYPGVGNSSCLRANLSRLLKYFGIGLIRERDCNHLKNSISNLSISSKQ